MYNMYIICHMRTTYRPLYMLKNIWPCTSRRVQAVSYSSSLYRRRCLHSALKITRSLIGTKSLLIHSFSTCSIDRALIQSQGTDRKKVDLEQLHIAYIALGSNLRDRQKYIQEALHRLDARGIQVINTSQLYESAPMYVTDQPEFLNSACCVMTTLSPHSLMKACQQIEQDMGRIKLVDKGARCIDLDILLYDKVQVTSEDLIIPHVGITERDFVYIPLSDITDLKTHNLDVPRGVLTNHTLKLHQPFLTPYKTNLMLIYNITPDSFSDGSANSLELLPKFLEDVNDVDIIDVGGQSTRPSATLLSAEEEAARVIPIIRKMRVLGWSGKISIDTFHASVARAALQAGADIINDVSGGTMDSEMLATAASFGCPIILMHMRGTPETMQNEQNLDYSQVGGVSTGMMMELNERYRNAVAAGVRTWNIILDPGISFSKNTEQNLELLRLPLGGKIPWLVGASRKGFIGRITDVKEAKHRTLGTAVCVAASIAQGARIVRVHDVSMREVVKMSDALYHGLGVPHD